MTLQEIAEIKRLRNIEVEDTNQRDKHMKTLRNMSIINHHKQKSMILADL
jgi:hypothetical protein